MCISYIKIWEPFLPQEVALIISYLLLKYKSNEKMSKGYILFWKQTYNDMSLQWYLSMPSRCQIHFTDFFQTIVFEKNNFKVLLD